MLLLGPAKVTQSQGYGWCFKKNTSYCHSSEVSLKPPFGVMWDISFWHWQDASDSLQSIDSVRGTKRVLNIQGRLQIWVYWPQCASTDVKDTTIWMGNQFLECRTVWYRGDQRTSVCGGEIAQGHLHGPARILGYGGYQKDRAWRSLGIWIWEGTSQLSWKTYMVLSTISPVSLAS